MTDRSMLFSGPMVRAILEGRKTQTRRPLKTLVPFHFADGDRLWVRETFRVNYRSRQPVEGREAYGIEYRAGGSVIRNEELPKWLPTQSHTKSGAMRWAPSIHMPRWASRLTLNIIDVRVQYLREISPDDAIAEGIEMHHFMGAYGWVDYSGRGDDYANRYFSNPRASFQTLWDSVYADRDIGWEANPLVVALTFDVNRSRI